MTSIGERIDNIIEQRRMHLPAVKAALARLEESYQRVKTFEEKCSQSLQNTETGELSGEYAYIFQKSREIDNINSFSFEDFYQAYEFYHEKLLQLQSRFEREKLHISFVGTAGQGKSLIMQQISGLDGTVIPSATGSDCTGAKSIITNNPSAEKVYAKITFFSKSEMVEIVNKYLDEIDQSKAIKRISSLSEVTSQLRTEVENIRDASRGDGAFAGTLLKYIDVILSGDLDNYYDKKDCLVTAEAIEQYVAQYSSKNPDIKYNKYLGVKCADIECRFPHSDAGKIVLVDTIGIGANSVGVEEDILHTVRYDSDIIVLMQRPDPIRFRLDAQHSRFAKQIIEAVTPECARNTFFWVLNKVQTGNLKNENALASVKKDIESSRMALSDILTLDCSSTEEVENCMIMPILEKLSSNMNVVDDMLIAQANACADDVAKALEEALNILDNVQADAEDNTFGEEKIPDIHKVFDGDMLSALRDQISFKYEKKRDASQNGNYEESEFAQKCLEILRQMLCLLPTEEKITEFLNTGLSGEDGLSALLYFSDNLRMDILDIFGTLDETLDGMTNMMKEETVNIMLEKGRLNAIVPRDTITSEIWAEKWLEKFLEKIKAEKLYPTIFHTFTEFKNFTFHVNGFMIYKIRRELEPLNYDRTENQKNLRYRNNPNDRPALAREIYQILEHDLETVYDKIRVSVQKLYSEPDCALWAAANDMYLRGCKLIDKQTGLKPEYEWHKLYQKWAHEIWCEDYLKTEGNNDIIKAWNETLRQLKEYTRENYFKIRKEA